MTVKAQILNMIDFIPDRELPIILEIVKRFATVEFATQDDLNAHRLAVQEYERGETVSHDDINWN